MEVSLTDLTEVTWMVLIQIGSVVVLTTGLTSTTRVLSVLTNSTLTGCLILLVFSCRIVTGSVEWNGNVFTERMVWLYNP
jgi:hypothetical protein